MTEIEKVSIGGYAFTLEKAAAEEVGQYLKNLEAHYLGKPGGKEIMEGIEERMAELLLERCGRGRVATMTDIQSLIGILGRPERIEADDPEPSQAQARPQKKLYRDLENKKIAGVCAGLGNYFNFDIVAMRIIFCVITLALFFGGAHDGVWSLLGFVAYGVLWLAMPAARTAQERWAMKGDAGTLDDIQRNIRNGVEEMGDAARRGMAEVRDTVRGHGNELRKIILLVLGIILLLGGVSGLASVSVIGLKGPTLFSAPIDQFLDDLSERVPIFYDMVNTPWILVLAVLAVVLPLIWLIYGGIDDGVWSLLGFVAYGVLWLAMPAARTAQERWAMKGDAGTLDDIQRNIRNGVEEMGDAARRGMNEVRDTVRGHGNELGKIILLVLGIILLLGGVSGLASVSVIGLKGPTLLSAPIDSFLDDISLHAPAFYEMINTPWILILTVLAIVLPLIWLIYGGILLIFGFKPPKWRPGLVIFVLWLIVLVVVGVLFAMGVVSTEYLHV